MRSITSVIPYTIGSRPVQMLTGYPSSDGTGPTPVAYRISVLPATSCRSMDTRAADHGVARGRGDGEVDKLNKVRERPLFVEMAGAARRRQERANSGDNGLR